MTIHEFGPAGAPALLLVHPSLVQWDYFEYTIPLLEANFRVFVPALPGYDPDVPGDFTSVEQVAAELAIAAAGAGRGPAGGGLRKIL